MPRWDGLESLPEVGASARAGRAVLPLEGFGDALERLRAVDWQRPDPGFAAEVVRALEATQIHAAHPRYFGLPHGTPSAPALLGAALAAAHDPELATRHHAPFAVAAERAIAGVFAARLLPGEPRADGIVTSGGSEANLCAVLLALAARDPGYVWGGVRGLARAPRVYASSDAHPSLVKALKVAGLGADALVSVPIDAGHAMRPEALAAAIGRDRSRGADALLVVATAGTTTTGAFDALPAIAAVAQRAHAWLHVDAAYGGLLALVPGREAPLAGCEHAASLAFDPHKTLDVPLGLGLFFTRRPELLSAVFGATARYLPRARGEPWATSLPWSRPFRALPLVLALAARGLAGVAAALEQKLATADGLRAALAAAGFGLVHASPLPIVCFVDAAHPEGGSARHLAALAAAARAHAGAYLPLVRLPDGRPVLRACVTSEHTRSSDVSALVAALVRGRPSGSGASAGDDPSP